MTAVVLYLLYVILFSLHSVGGKDKISAASDYDFGDKQIVKKHQQEERVKINQQHQQWLPTHSPGSTTVGTQSQKQSLKLAETKECNDDVQRLCSSTSRSNNFAVMDCLEKDVKTAKDVSRSCQHLLWTYKRNLTGDDRFEYDAAEVCKDELQRIPDCNSITKGNGLVIPCMVDHFNDITNAKCKTYIKKMKKIVFSDYRLVYRFVESCKSDIEKSMCGSIVADEESIYSQGLVLHCLAHRIERVESPECKHQILRVSELQSDDYHLDRHLYYACQDDREHLCPNVPAGEGKIYKCLVRNKFDKAMSEECRHVLTRRQNTIAEDVKVERTFYQACKKDIKDMGCFGQTPHGEDARRAKVLLCLKNGAMKGEQLAPECVAEMNELRQTLMDDFQVNPEIVSDCALEINQYCGGGFSQGGKTIHCLMGVVRGKQHGQKQEIQQHESRDEQYKSLASPKCQRALEDLIEEADVGSDYRMDKALAMACQSVVETACRDIQPGDARVLNCLMEKLDSSKMTDDCEEKLMEIQYIIVRNFRLDPTLYKNCHKDAKKLCHASVDWFKPDSTDVANIPMIFPCLYRHMKHHDKKADTQVSRACKHEMRRVMKYRAKMVDLDPELEKYCLPDLRRLCSDMESYKKGEEFACLQDNYEKIYDDDCHELIGNMIEDEDEFLELDNILMRSCTKMIKKFCKDDRVEDAEADEIMDCLIDHKRHPFMDPKCADGVEHHQLISLKDFRFNHKFKESCKKSVMKNCKGKKTKYDVVACLSEHVRNDTLFEQKHRIEKQCRKQLRVEILQRGESIDLDPVLQNSCNSDIQNMCNVEHGNSKVVECLRDKKSKLSQTCHRILFKREKEESLVGDYKLNMVCKQMIRMNCFDGEEDNVLDCLKPNKDKHDFDSKCRAIVIRRQISQNQDYRLNLRLRKNCKLDIPKFCRDIFQHQKNDKELEGKMINCLRKQFVINRLSWTCHQEIKGIIKESALNYLEDPVLAKACSKEIQIMCIDEVEEMEKNVNEVSDNGKGKVEECLKEKFRYKMITNPKCKQEIARINQETMFDINVDPLLHTACQRDLYKVCRDIEPGKGKQISCLLTEFKDHPKRLNKECFKVLKQRKELWEYSVQGAYIKLKIPPIYSEADEITEKDAGQPKLLTLVAISLIVIIGFISFCIMFLCRRIRMNKKHFYTPLHSDDYESI